MYRTALIAASVLYALATAPALATGEFESLITDQDRARLAAFEATRAEALEEARTGGSEEDNHTLEWVISRPALKFSGFDLEGDWECRTIKVGGLASLVVYSWFRCRVSDDGSGWRLEKLGGSQRTAGRLFDESDTPLIYLGSFYIAGETQPPYGSGPDSDQVGRAFRSSDNSWRIEFPAPRYESKLDILEFRR